VLEPLQPEPVIIEDDCFVGARAEVAEASSCAQGCGSFDGRLSRRIDAHRATAKPARSSYRRGPALIRCSFRFDARRVGRTVALLRGDRQEGGRADRSKTAINDLLRD
jgi:hypothetical protein